MRPIRLKKLTRRSALRTGALLPAILIAVSALAVVAGCRAAQSEGHFVVLLYHHVAKDTPAITSVSPTQFASHLDYLADNGFNIWPLTRAVAAMESGEAIPDRTVCITFDDAYRDILTNAAPMLKERGWPFTVFVATKAVDESHGGIMGWEELRELQSMGAELANHSHTHDHLIRRRDGESRSAWLNRVREDIETASKRLTEETGTRNRLFAWPYGEYNLALDELVSELGLVAFTQASGAVGAGYDRQQLPRFPVAGDYADLDQLRNRFDALPLPVRAAEPQEPQRPADERRPVLTLELAPGDYRPDALNCFVSGQGPMDPERLDDDPLRLRLQARELLPPGRSRYNCTAPASSGGRWYWYSRPWFLPNPDGSWPEE